MAGQMLAPRRHVLPLNGPVWGGSGPAVYNVFTMSTTGDMASEDFGTRGYAVSLPRSRTNFTEELQALRSPGAPFVDSRTQALSFSFNLLNGNDMAMPPFGP
jgi:hypothetical protein